MKRIYIKPETAITSCRLSKMLAASPNGTEWHDGNDGQNDDHTIGPDQPDPNKDAKGIYGYEDLWGDL